MKTLTLFDDQAETFANLRVGLKNYKSNLLVSPTGSGKTAIATHMFHEAGKKGKRVGFTVPRRTLMEQTSNTFAEYGIKHSFISAGKQFNPYAKMYIGTVDSMARRLDLLPDLDLLIVDETHFGMNALDKVIKHYKARGAWIVGLSASPWKLSGQGLGCWYDNIVLGKSVRWLMDNNRLSDYKYYCGRTRPDFSKVKVSGGDYAKGEIADFMEHQGAIIGDCVRDYRDRCMGRIHTVRCASIKHSEMVAESFRNEGIPAVHVDGKHTMVELRQIFRSYAKREISVVTFCDLLGFGFDLSQISGLDVCIESISDLKPSKSLAAQLQYWGRGLRYKEQPAIIMDNVNNHVEHGFPDDEREWTLEDRPQTKAASDERAVPTRLCESCFFTHRPAPVCPECGYVYPIKSREIEVIDGELVEINPAGERRKIEMNKEHMEESIKKMVAALLAKKKMPPEAAYQWAAKEYTKQQAKRLNR